MVEMYLTYKKRNNLFFTLLNTLNKYQKKNPKKRVKLSSFVE